MSSANKLQINESGKKDLFSIINKKVSIENANTQNDDEKIQNIENRNIKSCKLICIIIIVVGLLIIVDNIKYNSYYS